MKKILFLLLFAGCFVQAGYVTVIVRNSSDYTYSYTPGYGFEVLNQTDGGAWTTQFWVPALAPGASYTNSYYCGACDDTTSLRVLDHATGFIVDSTTFYGANTWTTAIWGQPLCGKLYVKVYNASTNSWMMSTVINGQRLSFGQLDPGLWGELNVTFDQSEAGLVSAPVYADNRLLANASVRACNTTAYDSYTLSQSFANGGGVAFPQVPITDWEAAHLTNSFPVDTNYTWATESTLARLADMVRSQFVENIDWQGVTASQFERIADTADALLTVVRRTKDPEIYVTNSFALTNYFAPTNYLQISNYVQTLVTNNLLITNDLSALSVSNYLALTNALQLTNNLFVTNFNVNSNDINIVVTNNSSKSNFWQDISNAVGGIWASQSDLSNAPPDNSLVPQFELPADFSWANIQPNLWAKWDPNSPLYGLSSGFSNYIDMVFSSSIFSSFFGGNLFSSIRAALSWLVLFVFLWFLLDLSQRTLYSGSYTQIQVPGVEIMGNKVPLVPWAAAWAGGFMLIFGGVAVAVAAVFSGGSFLPGGPWGGGDGVPVLGGGVAGLMAPTAWFSDPAHPLSKSLSVLNLFYPVPETFYYAGWSLLAWLLHFKVRAALLLYHKSMPHF